MNFRLQDQIGDVGAIDPGVVQPVVDTSAAGLIKDLAGAAEVGYKKIQTARGQQLGVDLTKELGAEVSYTQAEMALDAARQAAIDEGSKQGMDIAQGRSVLKPVEFRARAEARLRSMMAANPLFAEEIAKGFASVTRYDPRGETNAAYFAQLEAMSDAAAKNAANQTKYWEQFAMKFNVVPYSRPDWKEEAQKRSDQERKIETVEAKENATATELKSTIGIQYTAGNINDQFKSGLSQIPELNLNFDADDFDLLSWARNLNNEQRNIALAGINKVKTALYTRLSKGYAKIFATPEYDAAKELIDNQISFLKGFIENPLEGDVARMETQKKFANESVLAAFREAYPQLSAWLTILDGKEALLGFAAERKLGQKLTSAMSDWKFSSPIALSDPETTEDMVGFFNRILNIDFDNNPKIFDVTKSFAAATNGINLIYDNYDDLEPQEQQRAVQNMEKVFKSLANPRFAEMVSHQGMPEAERRHIQRNMIKAQEEHLPRLIRLATEEIRAVSGAELEIGPDGLMSVKTQVPGQSMVKLKQTVGRINNVIKGITHSTGTSGPQAYRKIAEQTMAPIEESVQREIANEEKPLLEDRETTIKEIEDLERALEKPTYYLRHLDQKILREKKERIKEINNRLNKIRDVVPDISLSDEDTLSLRIAAFKKRHPEDAAMLSDAEIADGLRNIGVA